jgi:PRTRC genetic system protein B
MKNITSAFQTLFEPKLLLTIYQQKETDQEQASTYVEAYSFNHACQPVNRRPLSLADNVLLTECIGNIKDNKRAFTRYEGVLPQNVLHIPETIGGHLVWYTKPRRMRLLFAEHTEIENAVYPIPAMLWRANCRELYVYALPNGKRPDEKTTIYHAPFFNVYESAKVCMGDVALKGLTYLEMEDFMQHWTELFFGSYFSHTNFENGVKGGMTGLWQSLKGSRQKFPVENLKKANINLKKILS